MIDRDHPDHDELVAEWREQLRRSRIDTSDPQNHEDWMDGEDEDEDEDEYEDDDE